MRTMRHHNGEDKSAVGTSSPDHDAVIRLTEAVHRLEARVGSLETQLGEQIQDVAAAVTGLGDQLTKVTSLAHARAVGRMRPASGRATGGPTVAETVVDRSHDPGDQPGPGRPGGASAEAEPRPGRWGRGGTGHTVACVVATGVIVAVFSYLAWGLESPHFEDRGATLALPPTVSAAPVPPAVPGPAVGPSRAPAPSSSPRPDDALDDPAAGGQGPVDGFVTGRDTPPAGGGSESSPEPLASPPTAAEGSECDRRVLALRRMELCRDRP